MSHARTIIQADEHASDGDLYLPRRIIRTLKIPLHSQLIVQFGKQSTFARVKGIDATRVTHIRPALAQDLHLPSGVPLLVRYAQEQHTLIFGPFVGVLFTSVDHISSASPFGSLTSFMNEVADTCQERGGFTCAFSLDDVNWETQTIRGMIRKNGIWHSTTLPLPGCIYNRLASRQAEKGDKVTVWMKRCKEMGIPFFNEQFLDKWLVHQALQTKTETNRYLPKTVRYHDDSDLRQMLTQYRVIYAKPTNGSMGKGIYQISRTSGGYQVKTAMSRGKGIAHKELTTLTHFLEKQFANKAYLLQQGLPLITMENCQVDFRVLVQKNHKGMWATTSLVARVGQNSVVSNVARGGSMMPAAQALQACGPWNGQRPSVASLKDIALAIAQTLEGTLSGDYAEFGIDLGVDTDGRVWLLEVNSKPSKAINTLPLAEGEQVPQRARPSVRRLMDYAAYLNGFPRRIKQKNRKKKR